jgi:hypothetical protein
MVTLIRSGFLLLLLLSGCGWDGTPTRQNDFVPLTSIEINAVTSTIAAQTSITLTATGDFSGLFTRDITDQVVWSSDVPAVADFATPTDRSRVTGLIPGAAVLRATVGNVSSTLVLTVSNATVTSMVITPAAPSVPKGRTSQFTVIGTFSDATSQDLTFDSSWTSSVPAVATISDTAGSKGLAQALTVGATTITSTFGGVSDSTLLTVTEPVLQSIAVSPANPSILTLSTRNFTAIGSYSDGSTPDITSQVAWSSSDTGIATIVASGGAATTLSQGTTAITATLDGVSGTSSLRATGGNLTSFTVSPTIVTLVKDTTVRMTATGTFSNVGASVTRDISGAVQWTSANTSLATVTAAGGNLMVLNAIGVTPTIQITATAGTLTPFATTLTVTAPQLQSIAIFTTSPELTAAGPLTAGTSARFTATATFIGNGVTTTQDVTTLCAWTSNNPTIATVDTSGLAAGRVTGVASGSTTISVTYTNNGITVTVPIPAPVNVLSRVLQSLTVSPATSTVTAGQQVSYTAVASYFGGTKDVTEDATWSTDNPNVAILADTVNQPGQVVAVDRGSVAITASFGGRTPDQAATITVTGP